jgi:ribosomal protein S18 acetylase RimI-like enzyme
MLRVQRHSDAGSFLAHAERWLSRREAEHNIILSVAYLLADGERLFNAPSYFGVVETEDGVVGCALCPPPDGLYLTPMPLAAVPAVVEQLRITHPRIPEVIGPEDVAEEFARLWRPGQWSLHCRMWRYSLERLNAPKRAAPGRLRPGDSGDLAIIDEWANAYGREMATKVDVGSFFRRMVERGSLYLWDDGGPRCVVTASGLTKNGARISSVYTPPQFRGNGYAENAVAGVTGRILESGRRFCVITADVDDPAPNTIYRRLGFQRHGAFAQIHFST